METERVGLYSVLFESVVSLRITCRTCEYSIRVVWRATGGAIVPITYAIWITGPGRGCMGVFTRNNR